MPLIDRVNRRTMLIWSTVLQLAAFVPFIFFDVTFLTALINVVLFGAGAGIGQQSLFQLWSGELFPTLLRSTAQGFMFGVVRIALGGWILLLPWVEDAGFSSLSAILFAMLAVSGLVGVLFAPDTSGARPGGDAGGRDRPAAGPRRCGGARHAGDQRLTSRSRAAAVGALRACGAGAAPGTLTVHSGWPGIAGVLDP